MVPDRGGDFGDLVVVAEVSGNFSPGAGWDAPFKDVPYWLRFELGGEELSNQDAPAPRFVQALSRSRAICDAVFAQTRQLWAIVTTYRDNSTDFFAPVDDAFEVLFKIGFKSSAAHEWNAALNPDDPDEHERDFVWRAFDITADIPSRDALLWCSLAYEMPVQPKCPVIVYLVDSERGILFHVYDDRGMDVIALSAATLLPHYEEFDGWLLDYDRDRMKAAFQIA